MSEDRLSSHLVKLARTEGGVKCGICANEIQARLAFCSSCESPYHGDCWQYNGGCAVYGCKEAPNRPEPVEVEVVIRRQGHPRQNQRVKIAILAGLVAFIVVGRLHLANRVQRAPRAYPAAAADLEYHDHATQQDRVRDQLISFLLYGDIADKLEALDRIQSTGESAPDVIEAVGNAILDSEEEIRGKSMDLLWTLEIKAVPALPRLLATLRDMDPKVRRQSAWTIGRMGPAAHSALQAVLDAVFDQEEDVRTAAIWAIGQLGEPDRNDLRRIKTAFGSDSNSYVRSKALEILLLPRQDVSPMIDAICIAARDSDASIRERARKHDDDAQKYFRWIIEGVVERLSQLEEPCACCARVKEHLGSIAAQERISGLDMYVTRLSCIETHGAKSGKCKLHETRESYHDCKTTIALLEKLGPGDLRSFLRSKVLPRDILDMLLGKAPKQ